MKFVYGFLGIAVGTFMVIKSEWLLSSFGTSALAEKYLGTSGGTRLMYKLLGILFILISLMSMTGILGSVIIGILGPLFGI
jgi:hypothetical protein